MAKSTYDQKIADKICDRLSNGESLRSICSTKGMPAKASVFRWLTANADFRDQYARAREAQADALFDEIVDIANTPVMGKKEKYDADGKLIESSTGDMIEHRRLQIEARKWVAAKLRPKVYGDKLDVDITGALDFVVSAKPVDEDQWLKDHGSGS
jgi:hemerythrin superfamily protein